MNADDPFGSSRQRQGRWGSLYHFQLQQQQLSAPESPLQHARRRKRPDERGHHIDDIQRTSHSSFSGYSRVLHDFLPRYKESSDDDDDATTCTILCLHRFKVWWMRPAFVHLHSESFQEQENQLIPPETLFLLYRDRADSEGNTTQVYRLILPVVLPLNGGTGFVSCSLLGQWKDCNTDESGRQQQRQQQDLVVTSEHSDTVGIYMGETSDANDVYAMIEEGIRMATELWTPTMKTNQEHDNSARSRQRRQECRLGWCTWNALYTEVDGSTIVEAVRKIRQQENIPVRWMILDDGWQHTTDDDAKNGEQWSQRLTGMAESPTKFSSLSLKETISKLREMGMETVWVWHTLFGYWLGLDPDTSGCPNTDDDSQLPPSRLYYPHFSTGILENDHSASQEASVERGIGVPDDPDKFFHAYHSYLRNCDVDGVKVDAQGVAGSLQPYRFSGDDRANPAVLLSKPNNVVLRMQNALADSVHRNFAQQHHDGPYLMHCMAHAPEVFFRLPSLYHHEHRPNSTQEDLPLFRAADDFYPDNIYSHGPHVTACAYNSLLLSHVSLPDWDMFVSSLKDERFVRLHAVSRCLSGGPIYLSDAADQINSNVVDWICCTDGATLICRETARPAVSCLLKDPNREPLIITNTNGRGSEVTSGVLGIFNLMGGGKWDFNELDYVQSSSTGTANPLSVQISPTDVPYFQQNLEQYENAKFLAVAFFSKRITLLDSVRSNMTMELAPLQSEAVSVFPVRRIGNWEFVPIGLAGKLNGGGAILSLRVSQEVSTFSMTVRGCGTFLLGFRAATNQDCTKSNDDRETPSHVRFYVYVGGEQVSTNVGTRQDNKLVEALIDAGFDAASFDLPIRVPVTEYQVEIAVVE